MFVPRFGILMITASLQTVAWAQVVPVKASAPSVPILSFSEPPVPSDPLELVSGNAEPVQTPEQRQAMVTLLNSARALSNVRAQRYHLVTTFQSFGFSASDGAWSLDDMSLGSKLYRWTAQGPGYSAINIVELHGVSSPSRHLSEIEILVSTNPSLNEAALGWANNWQQATQPQNGSTPQWREVFLMTSP